MRIVIMGNNDHKGGVIVHYLKLVKFLKSSGHEILCININNKGNFIFDDPEVTEINVRFQSKYLSQKIRKYLQIQYAIFQSKKFKPELFIGVGLGNAFAKVASSYSENTFKIYQEVIFDAKLDALRRQMNKSFDAVGVQTQGMIPVYKKNVCAQMNVNYLPCFFKDYGILTPAILPKKKDNTIKLAYFGRLAANKGLVNFIEATKEKFLNEDLFLDIYGQGLEYETIARTIKKYNLDFKIQLKGFFEDGNFPSLINEYDGVILPSIGNEGLPLIILECLNFKKPVFSTYVGAIPEIACRNKLVRLSKTDQTVMATEFNSFIVFINNLYNNLDVRNEFSDNNFSNESFRDIWTQMLQNPVKYFK